mmetsp:Transcript_82221/g.155022  ORF Transcript_82221/g.155022 Transcript_82221/m.155022 type:complete len:204 (+) Transcript_82221:803-1414(+)
MRLCTPEGIGSLAQSYRTCRCSSRRPSTATATAPAAGKLLPMRLRFLAGTFQNVLIGHEFQKLLHLLTDHCTSVLAFLRVLEVLQPPDVVLLGQQLREDFLAPVLHHELQQGESLDDSSPPVRFAAQLLLYFCHDLLSVMEVLRCHTKFIQHTVRAAPVLIRCSLTELLFERCLQLGDFLRLALQLNGLVFDLVEPLIHGAQL